MRDFNRIARDDFQGKNDERIRKELPGSIKRLEAIVLEARKVGGARFLGQGTLYPDVIESVSFAGGPSVTIKSADLDALGELSEEIDVPRAERAREAAAQRVSELSSGRAGAADLPAGADAPDVALREAEEALGRAELRLRVAGSGE